MRNDLEMVDFVLPKDVKDARIYPLGDLHLGSRECDIDAFLKWRDMVLYDPHGYVVIVGDLLDWGLKNSKTNIYEMAMTPLQQKEYLYELLLPLTRRIIGVVPGNHEYRGNREVGTCPLYDVCCRLGIEDVYRQNLCIIKFTLGMCGSNRVVYGIALHHGASKNKFSKFCSNIDGINLFFSGHTHDAEHNPDAKVVADFRHCKIRIEPYDRIVVPPFQAWGGYAIRGAYAPVAIGRFPMVELDGTKKQFAYIYK